MYMQKKVYDRCKNQLKRLDEVCEAYDPQNKRIVHNDKLTKLNDWQMLQFQNYVANYKVQHNKCTCLTYEFIGKEELNLSLQPLY